MGMRHKRATRCIGCRLHTDRCICASIPRLSLWTRVSLVAHRRELKKTTNTGTLALKMLENSALFAWGDEGEVLAPDAVVPAGYCGVVLAPEAPPLAHSGATSPPVCLVVPDGSWRQATKMARRIPALAGLPRVSLPPGPPTRFHLRDEPKEAGLATFEAIARALGILEGPEVETAMMAPFDQLVAATLAMRGAPLA